MITFVVSSDEAQDVVMSEHDRLIDLCLTEPGSLVSRGEDLHRYILSPPLAPPHLSKAPFANTLLQDNGPSYGSLDQQRQSCRREDISLYVSTYFSLV